MNEQPYSNREIKEKWDDIANALSRIEIQTTTTNGRVNKLEKWQSYVIGFCAAIMMLILPIVFVYIRTLFGS